MIIWCIFIYIIKIFGSVIVVIKLLINNTAPKILRTALIILFQREIFIRY